MMPKIRFKREDGTDYPDWEFGKIGNHTLKVSEKNKKLEPLPIYSISNKGGFVPQSEQFEGIDSSERGYDISMYKIVGKNTFAYNPARINVGSFGYSGNLDRVQISSLYVCFKLKPELSPFYLLQFMSSFQFNKSVLRNVEGGVRQYLFYDNFKNIRVPLPSLAEQEKIASILMTIDCKINLLTKKKKAIETYKKGLVQKIFSRELRFKRGDGTDYSEWKSYKLNEVLFEHKKRSNGSEQVHSVSVHKGVVNQIKHLGRSYAAKDVSNYNKVHFGDIIYTKSPTGNFPYGIIKQSYVDNAIVSPLYCVTSPIDINIGYLLNWFFESNMNVHNYLNPIIQKGAKNTINITNNTFLSRSLFLPTDIAERKKIKDVYISLNDNLRILESEILKVSEFKKGLFQQMFA